MPIVLATCKCLMPLKKPFIRFPVSIIMSMDLMKFIVFKSFFKLKMCFFLCMIDVYCVLKDGLDSESILGIDEEHTRSILLSLEE